jgi:hypothetical protein
VPQCCSIDGCAAKPYARGVCKPHYRKLPDQQARDREYERTKRGTAARLEQERLRNQRRREYINAWARRKALAKWGPWWERQRRREDLAEWERMGQPIGPHCHLKHRPKVRQFVGCVCQACGDPYVYYRRRAQSRYCADCNTDHHRRPANRRARQNGARYEVIDPQRVFERDGWKCQLCGRKTAGIFPDPRAPTLDHIVPLSKGGDHLYTNVQCACFECNSLKRDGSANDQLLLLGW